MALSKIQQNIPIGWKVLPIGKHIKLQGGNAFSASNYVSDGIPLVRIGNVGKGDFVASDFVYISEDEHASNESVHLRENDILMGMTGELGKVARIGKQYLPAILNQRVGRVVFKDKDLNPDFTFQIFLSKDFKSKLEKYFIGAAQKNISSSQVESVEVLLPPIKEQQKIAEILGTVDEDIAKTQEVIEATEKIKRGLMQQLFTRGIAHTKFKETKIGQIPEEWDVVSIRNSSIKLIDGDRGANYPKQEDFSPEGHCLFLSAKNVSKNGFIFDEVSFVSEEKDRALRKGKLERGDIILTSRGTVGNVAYYDEKITFDNIRINSGMLIVRHGEQFDPVFLYRYFSSPQMEAKYSSMGSGSAQPQLPVGSLEQVEVPLIPIKEQKEIADIISAVNEKILINKTLKEKLIILKKGLMQDLLSGTVRTNI